MEPTPAKPVRVGVHKSCQSHADIGQAVAMHTDGKTHPGGLRDHDASFLPSHLPIHLGAMRWLSTHPPPRPTGMARHTQRDSGSRLWVGERVRNLCRAHACAARCVGRHKFRSSLEVLCSSIACQLARLLSTEAPSRPWGSCCDSSPPASLFTVVPASGC